MVSVIEPMTSSARLKLNMKPEQSGFIMPKILLDVVFEQILVALAKSQVRVDAVCIGDISCMVHTVCIDAIFPFFNFILGQDSRCCPVD